MNAILDFFEAIGQAITSVIDFVIGLFQDLVYMVSLLTKVVSNFPSYFSWLPSSVVALLVSLVAIIVIYKIIGREG